MGRLTLAPPTPMFTSNSHLEGAKLTCNDGDLGHVREVLLDTCSWTLRYLVIETGAWFDGRARCLPMLAMPQPIGATRHFHVDLSRNHVRSNPDPILDHSANRTQERRLLRQYQLPDYWSGGPGASSQACLLSNLDLTGCEIHGSGASLGRVQDLVFDDSSWAMRYFVVDTGAWWQNGNRALIGVQWADLIDPIARRIEVRLDRDQVRGCPRFEDVASIHRTYELRLHACCDRTGYWA